MRSAQADYPFSRIAARRILSMISNGNVTAYVSDLDDAIRFYTQALGLKLTNRFGQQWATIQTGPSYWTDAEIGAGLVIGLHPRSQNACAPGTVGSIGFGLETYEPLEQLIPGLERRGVKITSEIVRFEAGNTVSFEAIDGHPSYVHEFPEHMLSPSDLERSARVAPNAPRDTVAGGHAIVYVSNMDAAVKFYSEILELPLTNRFGDHLATVEAGDLVIALHPQTARSPKPGIKGSMVLGLVVDDSIKRIVTRLAERGVRVTGNPRGNALRDYVEIEDVDGNAICLWEKSIVAYEPEQNLKRASAR
jgi:catechol 2,3-dioxygenase-like lactoylglutathione lyase family enzyme